MNTGYDEAAYEAEVEELRAERNAERRHRQLLARAPLCSDPDHPGCGLCCEDDKEDEDD